MHRRRKSSRKRLSLGVLPYAAVGLAVLAAAATLSAALTFFVLGSCEYIGFFAAASEVVGACSGAMLCGKYRRRHGLAEGAVVGALMYAVVSVIGIILFGSLKSIPSLLRYVVAGACGGVRGVNSPRPKEVRNLPRCPL